MSRPQQRRARWLPRSVWAALAAAVLASSTMLVVPAVAAPASAQMPFPCGETWYAHSYTGHTPSPYALDWNLLNSDYGRSVRAGVTGTAAVFPNNGGYGNLVEVNTGDGWTYRYAHLSAFSVSNGQAVTPQTEIGKVGASGAEASHLHYEQRLNGVVQPATFNGSSVAYTPNYPGNPYTSANCAAEGTYQSFAGDFNGDGQADIGLRNKNTGVFYLRYGPTYGPQDVFQWDNSVSSYQAFAGDFNGDGQADVGLRNPVSGWFYLRYGPNFTAQTAFQWDNSVSSYQAFAGDFNGDGQADVGLRNPVSGWFYLRYGPGFTAQTAYQWDIG